MSSSSSPELLAGLNRYGADLDGSVEFRQESFWYAAINAGLFLIKNYDLFGCLFGVANMAGFRPLFAGRGLPTDSSDDILKAAASSSAFGHSWASLPELQAVDWTEEATRPDARIAEYEVGEDGSLTFLGKADASSYSSEIAQAVSQSGSAVFGHRLFRREVLRRSDAIKGQDYATLLALMEVLGRRFGAENVRLVVYFDA